MKRYLLFIIFLFLSSICSADTLILNSGKKIEGEILERTDEYVKIDFDGIILTFFNDEVKKIDEISEDDKSIYYPDVYSQRGVLTGERCFLWKVQSEISTAYILGSIHLANKEIYPLNKKIEEAFNKSDVLVVEVNVSEADPLEMLKLTMEKVLYPEDDSLERHISKSTYTLVGRKLKEMGSDINSFNNYKPWFLSITMMTLELQSLGFDPNYGIDLYFLSKAVDKKRILELEDFDFQINLLDGFSDYYQELLLLSTILDLNTIEKEMAKLINAWTFGDIDTMQALLFAGLSKQPKILPLYEKLYFERNRKMASKIEGLLKTEEDYFIVVGAGHLVGKESIIELLKEKGYFVKQL